MRITDKITVTEGMASPGLTGRMGSRRRLGRWILLAVFALGIGGFFLFDLGRFLSLEALQENRDALLEYTHRHYVLAVLVFIGLYCIQTALSLPGATILTLAGGFLFGSLWGTLYVNVGASTGATLAFFAARYLFRDAVQRRFGGRLETIERGFNQNAFHYLLMLRLIPVFPFFLVNLAAGLTGIRTSTYVLATVVGILPGSFVYCNAGSQLGGIRSVEDIASPAVIGALALLGLLALTPVAYQKWQGRKRTVSSDQ